MVLQSFFGSNIKAITTKGLKSKIKTTVWFQLKSKNVKISYLSYLFDGNYLNIDIYDDKKCFGSEI